MCPAGPELFDFFAATAGAAEVITGVQARLDTLQADVAKMTEMLGKPGEYTDKDASWPASRSRSAAARGRSRWRVWRRAGALPATSASGARRRHHALNRAVMTTHIKCSIDEQFGLTADVLNTAAWRKALDADIRNPMGPYDELVPFDGKLERPTLTMHGTGDLFVPIFLEQSLKRAVVASGRQALLAQRIYRIAGHCGFSQPEMIKSFDDLTAWVHKGTKPAGDEVSGDLSNAGMTFTDPLRPNDPGGIRVGAAPKL